MSHFSLIFPSICDSLPSQLSLFSLPPYQFLFCPSSCCSWYSLMCRGNAAPRGIPPPPPQFLISLSPTDLVSHYPSPLFVQVGLVHELTGTIHLVCNRPREPWDGRTDTSWWNFVQKNSQQGKRKDQGEGKRVREGGRQLVGGRWGILAENRTLVIFSFLPDSLFGRHLLQLLLSKRLWRWKRNISIGVWSAAPSHWMPEMICRISF